MNTIFEIMEEQEKIKVTFQKADAWDKLTKDVQALKLCQLGMPLTSLEANASLNNLIMKALFDISGHPRFEK